MTNNFLFIGKFTPPNYIPRMNTTRFYKLPGNVGVATIGSGVIVRETSSLLLKCPINKFGPVYIIWKQDSGSFERTGRLKDGGVLMKNLKVSDSGTYVCYSSDIAKVLFGSIQLRVLGMSIGHFMFSCHVFKILFLVNELRNI